MIRAATADDFDAIAAITAYYVERTAIHFAYQPPGADELRAQWGGPDDRHPWLVADDGVVRGYAKAGELVARGFHTAIAGITLPNPASVALFERADFAFVGVFREVGWKLDAWHDVGFWQRLLVGGGAPPATADGVLCPSCLAASGGA